MPCKYYYEWSVNRGRNFDWLRFRFTVKSFFFRFLIMNRGRKVVIRAESFNHTRGSPTTETEFINVARTLLKYVLWKLSIFSLGGRKIFTFRASLGKNFSLPQGIFVLWILNTKNGSFLRRKQKSNTLMEVQSKKKIFSDKGESSNVVGRSLSCPGT